MGSWVVSSLHFCVTRPSGLQPHPLLTYACRTMGSVSSLINGGNSLNSNHCKASDYRSNKGTNHHRKSGGCSLDGLLKCSFTQCSSTTTHPSKGLTHSRSGRSEDFFYIKVSSCAVRWHTLHILNHTYNIFKKNKTFNPFYVRWAINRGQRTTEEDLWKTMQVERREMENQTDDSNRNCCSCRGKWRRGWALLLLSCFYQNNLVEF